MSPVTAALTAEAGLAAIVGPPRVSSDPAICGALAVDGKVPSQVVYPASAEDVAAVLKYCADHDLALIPCRNATKLAIGNPPRLYDVALSLKDMNQVWYYEPADLVVSVEPGMKLGDLQHLLARNRLWLPLDPAGGDRASIGGILAANATGPLGLRYGGPRDCVLGMKIATTEGKIVKTGGRVVKNVAGYDLAKLLIGSFGTLGVIVEAAFKLYPVPAGVARFRLAAATLDVGRQLRQSFLRSPLRPQRMALVDGRFLSELGEHPEIGDAATAFELWIEVAGAERTLNRARRELRSIAAAAGAGIRELAANPFADESLWQPPNAVWRLKVALPIAAVEEFLDGAARVRPADQPWSWWAEPGVGFMHGCLRSRDSTADTEDIDKAIEPSVYVRRLRSLAAGLGGTLVVEAAPSPAKSAVDVWGPVGDDFELMRKLKAAWDPHGVLAPGRFMGGI